MSADVVLEASDEEILLYFKINGAGLDAQTFANALLSFDELYRAMDAVANPGREIEVDFIRSDQGSIRAVIRVFTKDVKTLLRAPLTLAILPCLLGYLINKVTSDSVSIVVNDSSYIVEHGTERIILPRDAAKIIERFNREPAVRRSVRKFFSVVDSDPSVREVDFRSPKAPDKPVLPISRDQFVSLRDLPEIELSELPKKREEPYSQVPVVVLTAVLEGPSESGNFFGMVTRSQRTFATNPFLQSSQITNTNLDKGTR